MPWSAKNRLAISKMETQFEACKKNDIILKNKNHKKIKRIIERISSKLRFQTNKLKTKINENTEIKGGEK